MRVGDQVKSLPEPELGAGRILGMQTFFDENYVEVFFEQVSQRRVVPASALQLLSAPEEGLAAGVLSPAALFLFQLTAEWALQTDERGSLKTAGNFSILPLPHQLLAVRFVMDQFKPRVLIADEVGLGKTVEAALIYEELKARGLVRRILIVVPSGLCLQWKEEMRSKFKEEFALYDKETIHSLKQLHGETTNVWSLSDRIITSLDFIKPKKLREDLSSGVAKRREWHNKEIAEAAVLANFDLVLFDEAHKLTKAEDDTETARYKIAKKLSEAVPFLLLLTATPHQGDRERFRHLLQLIDPIGFYRNSEVTPEKVRRITVRNQKRAVTDFQGNRLFKQRLVSLCVLERDPLQDKIELDLYQAVTEYVREFYELASRENNMTKMFLLLIYQRMVSSSSRAIYKSLSGRLAALEAERERPSSEAEESEVDLEALAETETEMQWETLCELRFSVDEQEIQRLQSCVQLARQAAFGRNDAKLVRLLTLLDEFRSRENEPNLKFIVFTEFRETQEYLCETLQRLGYTVAVINGGIPMEERVRQVEKFRAEAQFLVSTDAGGEGINLQFCRVMINYDLPWNPMRLEQRIGRIDRIGQRHDVKVVNFQLADTVEQRIRDVIERKLEIIRQEFQAGEDKLADILSTLQDQFSFENLYVHALRKRELAAAEMEAIANTMLAQARRMIEEQELAIPGTNLAESYSVSEQDIQQGAIVSKLLLERYLAAKGDTLLEQKTHPGIFSFRDPESGKRYGKVVFDPRLAVDEDRVEHITLQHPILQRLLASVEQVEAKTARIEVKDRRFAAERGFLFIYRFLTCNYVDVADRRLITVFVSLVTPEGRVNQRISQYFSEVISVRGAELIIGVTPPISEAIKDLAEKTAREKAESLFYETRERQAARINEEERRFSQYEEDRAKALAQVALEAVRKAKEAELLADREAKRLDWIKRRQLSPHLELVQLAYVEFCDE